MFATEAHNKRLPRVYDAHVMGNAIVLTCFVRDLYAVRQQERNLPIEALVFQDRSISSLAGPETASPSYKRLSSSPASRAVI